MRVPKQHTYFRCRKCDHVADWYAMRKLLSKNYSWRTVLACPKCASIDVVRTDPPVKEGVA